MCRDSGVVDAISRLPTFNVKFSPIVRSDSRFRRCLNSPTTLALRRIPSLGRGCFTKTTGSEFTSSSGSIPTAGRVAPYLGGQLRSLTSPFHRLPSAALSVCGSLIRSHRRWSMSMPCRSNEPQGRLQQQESSTSKPRTAPSSVVRPSGRRTLATKAVVS